MERKIFDKQSTKKNRRNLKKNQTTSEQILWSKLRGRRFMNLKFRRQHGIGEYIADFYCPELKLVIEIDGNSHYSENSIEYDSRRTKYINSLGIEVLRFTNDDVYNELDSVLNSLMFKINTKLQKTSF